MRIEPTEKKLLMVAATQAELDPLFKHFGLPLQELVALANFDILITGVGMTATAFSLGRHLHHNYSLALNVGIAGSFDLDLPLGSLVSVVQDTFSELGAEDHHQFLTIDELGFGSNTTLATATLRNLPPVNGITVNKVHGSQPSIDAIKQLFDVQTESMEGAAFFYACEKMNLPCAQVRAISNYVQPRVKADWKIGLAITNLNHWLIQFLTDFKA
jgi:futalosine hydrolase